MRGVVRKTAEDLGASLTSPLNLGLTATGIGAGVAGKAGMLGISKGARLAEAALQAPLVAEGIHGAVTGDSVGEKLGGVAEAALGAHGMKSAATHSFDPKKVISTYMEEHGLQPHPREAYDPEVAKVIADHYEKMPHAPNDPKVAASYQALNDQIGEQHAFLAERAGVKVEPWTGQGEPYSGSKAMQEDVVKNNHLFFLPTDKSQIVPDHPMAAGDSNDQFRAVHDYFGHAAEGNSFGPKGEEAAFQAHKDTLAPDAHGALTTETKGQNSWVNSGQHLRDAQGNIPSKGQPGFVPAAERPFAEQKAGLLPDLRLGEASPSGSTAPATTGPSQSIQLEHRSSVPGLTELDPQKYGSGQAGAERARQAASPSEFVPRTYYTRAGGPVEPRFQKSPHVYTTSVPEHAIYDLGADPKGFVQQAIAEAPGDPKRVQTLAERLVQQAGFDGYHNSLNENPAMKDTVALFKAQPVSPTRQDELLKKLGGKQSTPKEAVAKAAVLAKQGAPKARWQQELAGVAPASLPKAIAAVEKLAATGTR